MTDRRTFLGAAAALATIPTAASADDDAESRDRDEQPALDGAAFVEYDSGLSGQDVNYSIESMPWDPNAQVELRIQTGGTTITLDLPADGAESLGKDLLAAAEEGQQ